MLQNNLKRTQHFGQLISNNNLQTIALSGHIARHSMEALLVINVLTSDGYTVPFKLVSESIARQWPLYVFYI